MLRFLVVLCGIELGVLLSDQAIEVPQSFVHLTLRSAKATENALSTRMPLAKMLLCKSKFDQKAFKIKANSF